MSDIDNDQPVDDSALFEAVVSGTPIPDQATQPATQPRDDTGRFAGKTTPEIITPAATAQATAPAADPAADAHVPSSRLREEADARRAAERERDDLRSRLAGFERQQPRPQAQPEPAKPDMWADPDVWHEQRTKEALAPIENMFRGFILSQSMQKATAAEGGRELVTAAEQSVRQAMQAGDPDAQALLGRLKSSFDPVGDIITFHRNRTALSEIGNDPAAYKQRVLDEAMKDPAFQAKVLEASRQTAQPVIDTGRQNVTPMTPSIRNIGGGGASPASAEAPSDAELFSSVTGRRRA